jgi:putative peptide zinc metalloprotease protein
VSSLTLERLSFEELEAENRSGSPHQGGPVRPAPRPQRRCKSGSGDNQALAVNTTDGSTNYVVALSHLWVTNGGPVKQRNTAYAAASCSDCRTVAVAFQVLFVVGYAQVITPINDAVAVNYQCTSCTTNALAVQLAVSLTRRPRRAAMKKIAAVWAQLERARSTFEDLPLPQVYGELTAARTQLLEILAADGDLPPDATNTKRLAGQPLRPRRRRSRDHNSSDDHDASSGADHDRPDDDRADDDGANHDRRDDDDRRSHDDDALGEPITSSPWNVPGGR